MTSKINPIQGHVAPSSEQRNLADTNADLQQQVADYLKAVAAKPGANPDAVQNARWAFQTAFALANTATFNPNTPLVGGWDNEDTGE